MKVNIQKTKNRLISMLGAVCVFVSCMAVPVLAVDANGNEFFSPLDYGTIIDSFDSSNIIYRTSTPTDWILTNARNDIDPEHEWMYPIGDYMGQSVEFWYSGTAINLLMKPWTGSNIGAGVSGTHVQNGHIVDLTYFPDNTTFSGGFDVTIFSGGDVGYKAECWFILHFVDSDGLVVHSYYRRIEPEIVNHTNNTVTYRYDPSINLGNLDLPDTVAGMIPVYTLKHLYVNDNYQIIVDYDAPSFEFAMNALEMEAHNNSQLQYTIKAVQELQEQMDKQEEMFENLQNGTPEQNEIVDSAVDDMNQAGDKLGELGDSMSSIEKPDTSDIKVGINDLVPETSLLAYTAPILQIWNNDTLVAMLVIVVTLVLVSWIFFGKKG